VTNMNISMQKKLGVAQKKAELYDSVIKRCVQLESDNQRLIRMLTPS